MFESFTALVPHERVTLPAAFESELEAAADYARNSKAAGTLRAYQGDWRAFEQFCTARGLDALPATPAAVAAYLAAEAERGMSASTIGRRCAAIKWRHKIAGHVSPTDSEAVKATLAGIRREIGTAPLKRKKPLTNDLVLAAALQSQPIRLVDIRNRALLLFAFASAMRRSEIVALTLDDIEFSDAGLKVTIRRSKGDQEGKGQVIAIPRGDTACPVAALQAWIEAAGLTEGRVFRSVRKGAKAIGERLTAQVVASVVKRYAASLGHDERHYGAHSTRAGWTTSAAARGANLWRMADHTRHRSLETLRLYVRNANLFDQHAGAGLL
jgi:site-specific recombinase XerD